MNYVEYNAVDDPVYPMYGGATITNKCIGPIEYEQFVDYDFEYVWFTDIVDYVKMKSMVVEYKDGTKKKFTGKVLEPVGDYLESLMVPESLVKDLAPIEKED